MSDNVYEAALKILDEFGWHQGSYGTDAVGYCAVGALSKAAMKLKYTKNYAADALVTAGLVPPVAGVLHPLASYNDLPSTSEEDIRLILKKGAELDG